MFPPGPYVTLGQTSISSLWILNKFSHNADFIIINSIIKINLSFWPYAYEPPVWLVGTEFASQYWILAKACF